MNKYIVIGSDGISFLKTFKSMKNAKKFYNCLINNKKYFSWNLKPNLKHISIFKNEKGFHSTLQNEYLITKWEKNL